VETRLKLLGHPIHPMTAWLGGDLVYRLRVAVGDEANLDASHSLQRESAVRVET
jgi:hypothetical protein